MNPAEVVTTLPTQRSGAGPADVTTEPPPRRPTAPTDGEVAA
ncbi:hypothetical protein [Streptomyces pinistramenti]|nr:hypothetical protein [Streptomyces pinistramenti]